MIKQIALGAFLCCGINATADCFDVLDPNNTIRTNSLTVDDAKRCGNYVLENVQFDSEADDEDCITADDMKCLKTAFKVVFYYFEDHDGIPKNKFLFPNEDLYALFQIHTFSKNGNLTPTLDSYKSFLNYMIGLYDASISNSQLKSKNVTSNRTGLHLARFKKWKDAGKLDSIANVGYKYSLRTNKSRVNTDYLDSLISSYNAGATPILDIQIKDKEFETVTDDLRLKLLKCQAYSFYCDKKGIKNKEVSRAKDLLEKWKKIYTDRFGEILLTGDKKFYISNYLVVHSLTECGNEMDFNDHYKMVEDIVIDNIDDDAFKTFVKMYKENTLYDYIRSEYLRKQSVIR